jgi:hypothetical protein
LRCIDKTGKLIQPQFGDCALSFSEGLAAIDTTNEVACNTAGFCRVGYIDKTGKMVIEPKFTAAKDFSEGLAPVALYSNRDPGLGVVIWPWVYIDKTGKVVISTEFEAATSFSEGLAAIKMGGKWGYISR